MKVPSISPKNLSQRLSDIRDQLAIYESEQRALIGNRGNSPSLLISPDEDIDRVERAYRMARRGGLMHPPSDEQEVAEFEKSNGIRLPRDYRRFIIEIGNGGEGPPFYGLLPLGVTPEHDVPDELRKGYSGLLNRPFSFTKPWCREDEESGDLFTIKLKTIFNGSLIIGHDGYGAYWSLVVAGEQKGWV